MASKLMLVAAGGVAVLIVGLTVGQKSGWFKDLFPITEPTTPVNPPSPTLFEIDGISFHAIPPGQFVMGSPRDEPGHQADENQKPLQIPEGFALSTHEITVGQYWSVIDSSQSFVEAERSKPITNISWEDAQEYCRQLNLRNPGHVFRLPTEEEWEYACRAGTSGPFGVWEGNLDDELERWQKFGDDGFINRHAPRSFNFGSNSPRPVGSYRPNAFGLYDMHGNVWEWCSGPGPSFQLRPIRGGAFSSPSLTDCRSAKRAFEIESSRRSSIGFRVVVILQNLAKE
jgi:formylglycine-generating enzyme required for sulfatase activity